MKTRLAIFVTVFILFMGTVFNILQSMDYTVNLHHSDITDTHHTYKLYNCWTDAMIGRNVVAECKIPIMSNGNYPGNPSALKMKQWIAVSSYNPSWFKVSNL